MNKLVTNALRAAACVALCAGTAHGQTTVTLSASRDNTMYEPSFEFDQYSNGQGSGFFAGTNLLGLRRRALIQFDLAPIPAGSTITGVELQLYCTAARAFTTSTLSLRRTLADWGEGASLAEEPGGSGMPAENGDATWTHAFYAATTWVNPGGDFAATTSAAASVPDLFMWITWGSTSAMVSDVQAWLDAPAQNFGWTVGDFGTVEAARRFASREYPDLLLRPKLVVTYTEPQLCNDVDYNNDGLFPDTADIDDFLSVFSGGPCSTEPPNGTGCDSVDFNTDGLLPDTMDIDSFLSVFSGGPCLR